MFKTRFSFKAWELTSITITLTLALKHLINNSYKSKISGVVLFILVCLLLI